MRKNRAKSESSIEVIKRTGNNPSCILSDLVPCTSITPDKRIDTAVANENLSEQQLQQQQQQHQNQPENANLPAEVVQDHEQQVLESKDNPVEQQQNCQQTQTDQKQPQIVIKEQPVLTPNIQPLKPSSLQQNLQNQNKSRQSTFANTQLSKLFDVQLYTAYSYLQYTI